MTAQDLQTWAITGAAIVGAWIAWRAYQTGQSAADQAAEGVSIVGDWLDESVGDVWRDITRDPVQAPDSELAREAAIAAEFGADWKERLDPWDPELAARIRAFLRNNGYHGPEIDGENGVYGIQIEPWF